MLPQLGKGLRFVRSKLEDGIWHGQQGMQVERTGPAAADPRDGDLVPTLNRIAQLPG